MLKLTSHSSTKIWIELKREKAITTDSNKVEKRLINFLENMISKKIEKILLINIIGVLEVLEKGNLSFNEAEKFLFSPYFINKLKKRKCNNKIIEILERGCELEDIASLLPQNLEKNIAELKKQTLETIEQYPNFENEFWIS